MSAGTLVLTNNSDVATGTGTTFTTDLVAGDFVVATVGGITYTLPVKSVDSDTQVTFIRKYTGPTQANSAWNAVPRATQNQVTAELVAQSAEALRGQNLDKANWQAVFSASGNITVILTDGSTFTGPSWNKIAQLLEDIDPVALQALADRVNADALQVAADRLDVDSKAQQVHVDAQTATAAAGTATTAAGTATTANSAAQQAKTDAEQYKIAAEAARDAAQTANPDLQLRKANNLSDVQSASQSRKNIGAAGSLDWSCFIRGFDISVAANVVTIGPGSFSLPDGSVLTSTANITINKGATSANTWYHLYLYSNSGLIAGEISATSPVAYSFPAHQKTGDATRRYLCSLRSDASSNFPRQTIRGAICSYQGNWDNYRFLSGGSATTLTALTLSSVAPETVIEAKFSGITRVAGSYAGIYLENNDSSLTYTFPSNADNTALILDLPIISYPNVWWKFTATPPGGANFTLGIGGYKYAR